MLYCASIFIVLVILVTLYFVLAAPKLPLDTDEIIDRVMQGDLSGFITGETGYATSDGLDIWYERINAEGAAKGVILLLMSNAGSAMEWPPSFVSVFVDAGYQVIRYDHRGTGMSDWVENWSRKTPYSLADMAGDAVAVLDALHVEKAHLVGLSMGGMIAQEMVISHPDRVASLTLMMTSGFIGDPDLPGLTSRYFLTSLVMGLPLLKYRIMGGDKNLVKERIAKTIVFVGRDNLDIDEIAKVVLHELRERRGVNIRAVFQHQTALTIAGSRYDRLKTLDVPTLIIHGTADQLIPVEHGRKLAETIPDAEGLWLEDVGHVFPYPNMEKVNQAILAHLAKRA